MSFISFMKGVWNKMLGKQTVVQPFGVSCSYDNNLMKAAIEKWDNLYTRSSSNLASIIAAEAARIVTVDMAITVDERGNGRDIQKIIDNNLDRIRSKVELGAAYGSLILKPNGTGIDFLTPNRFVPLEFDDDGNIYSIIFIDQYKDNQLYITRLEYHHFLGDKYIIDNKCFSSSSSAVLGSERPLDGTRWANIAPHVELSNIEKPLFGYFKMPFANNVDVDSSMGISIFSKAVDTIKDFDMWYSSWRHEGEFSKKIVFVDENAMLQRNAEGGRAEPINPIPGLIKGLRFGNNASKCIEEYNPTIRVDEYREALQTQLDLISVQCGFSTGYFSFDAKTGAITATEVLSKDQRTFSTCTDIQNNLRKALQELIYAMNVMISLYSARLLVDVEVSYYFKDLFINYEDDRNRAYQLSQNGYIPKWKYLVDYEGYSEAEAKYMISEANSESSEKQV